jgi:hypothetical protein
MPVQKLAQNNRRLLDVILQKFKNGLGIGTQTVPHEGVGWAKLHLEGTANDISGPHVQMTVSADDYPLIGIYPWSHDSIYMTLDSYYDGTFRSSDAGSNIKVQKNTDKLSFQSDTGIAQGSAVTWNDDLVWDLSSRSFDYHECNAGLTRATAQSILNNNVTNVDMTATMGNRASWADTSTEYITPTVAGWYICLAISFWAANSSGDRWSRVVAVNGTNLWGNTMRIAAAPNVVTYFTHAVIAQFDGSNDGVYMQVLQDSTSTINLDSAVLWVSKLGI